MEDDMAEAVSSNFLPLNYVYAARFGEGRATVPVLRSQALYANFAHVSGVPAEAGTAAFSIDKVHILEVLISQLQSVKQEPLAALEAPRELGSGRIDALIQQYGSEIHAIATAPALPYAPQPSVAPGSLFALAA
jgi:hypothetical protein